MQPSVQLHGKLRASEPSGLHCCWSMAVRLDFQKCMEKEHARRFHWKYSISISTQLNRRVEDVSGLIALPWTSDFVTSQSLDKVFVRTSRTPHTLSQRKVRYRETTVSQHERDQHIVLFSRPDKQIQKKKGIEMIFKQNYAVRSSHYNFDRSVSSKEGNGLTIKKKLRRNS